MPFHKSKPAHLNSGHSLDFDSDPVRLSPHLNSLCIMVIDECSGEDLQDTPVGHALQYIGHRVFYARKAFEALQMLEAKVFDLILIDMDLESMNSFATVELIQAFEDSRYRDVPIVALRDNMAVETKKRCESAGILTALPGGLFISDGRVNDKTEENDSASKAVVRPGRNSWERFQHKKDVKWQSDSELKPA